MRCRSLKRQEQWRLYEKAKRVWRKARIAIDGYLRCEAAFDGERCRRVADKNPHHKWGREGKLLYDTRYFMAVCPFCHRLIDLVRTGDAYKLGYKILRSMKKVVEPAPEIEDNNSNE